LLHPYQRLERDDKENKNLYYLGICRLVMIVYIYHDAPFSLKV
jgi:hypothetical protein